MGPPNNGPTTPLYDPHILTQLNWDGTKQLMSPQITNHAPGEAWLKVRPLELGDFEKGYLQLLAQLTSVGTVTRAQFERNFWEMQRQGCYFITVIEDTRSSKIIGAASLITELKFIHECGLRARLEDVVVNNTYRGKQLGKLIVLTVSVLARHLGCYKMTLDCKDNLIPFYKSIGYKCEVGNANSMTVRYDDTPL